MRRIGTLAMQSSPISSVRSSSASIDLRMSSISGVLKYTSASSPARKVIVWLAAPIVEYYLLAEYLPYQHWWYRIEQETPIARREGMYHVDAQLDKLHQSFYFVRNNNGLIQYNSG